MAAGEQIRCVSAYITLNLNVKNPIIFGNVRIMYAKHFPDTQLCPVYFSRRMGQKPIQIIKAW